MSITETTEEIPVYKRLEKLGSDLMKTAKEMRQRELTLDPKVAEEFWNGKWYEKFNWKPDGRTRKLEIGFVLMPKDLNQWKRYNHYFRNNFMDLEKGWNEALRLLGLSKHIYGPEGLWVTWNFMGNSPEVNQKFFDLIHSGAIELENPSELSSHVEPILEHLKKGQDSLRMLRNVAGVWFRRI